MTIGRSARTLTIATAALAVATALGVTVGSPTLASSVRAAGAGYCSGPLPIGSEPVTLDPSRFVERVDNAYWPMTPGNLWVSRESEGEDHYRVRVEVLHRTKSILGIDATVVHDTVSHRGTLVENTFDWYAQDDCDNVWYLGENTREYEDGQVVSREGSWQAGVDGAQAGIALPGDPIPGLEYRQEYQAGEAEDQGRVLSLDEQVKVPAGHFADLLMTRDTTPLEPRVQEYKFYAPGVGPVLALQVSGGTGAEELLRYRIEAG